jgi:hypothetical protein
MTVFEIGARVRRTGESNTGVLTVMKIRACRDHNGGFAGYAYYCEWSPGDGHEFPDYAIELVDAS